jgi:phosphorylase/glycogen(starch) synthase
MNGVMHFSVLDGWWVEGYREGAGWALPQKRTYEDQNYQNELDSATIYATIESEIAPAYYDVDKASGLSPVWVGFIKNTIAQVACNFTTNRMLTDYCEQYYQPQYERFTKMCADDYKIAREISAWKRMMEVEWSHVRIVSYSEPDPSYVLSQDDKIKGKVVLDLGRIRPEDIGIEIVFTTADSKGEQHIQEVAEMHLTNVEGSLATFEAEVMPEHTGMYQVGKRVFPKNPLLPHRQDFPLVKWL